MSGEWGVEGRKRRVGKRTVTLPWEFGTVVFHRCANYFYELTTEFELDLTSE